MSSPRHTDRTPRSYLLAIAAILGSVLLIGVVLLFGVLVGSSPLIQAQADAERLLPLRAVCDSGVAVPDAPAYTADSGPNKVVVYLSTDDGQRYDNRTEDYPRRWRAATVAEAELVACAQTGTQIIETCDYTLADNAIARLQREQYTLTVKLYAPRSGELLDETTLTGVAPRACQGNEAFTSGATTQTVTGDPINPAEVEKWLLTHVEP